MARKPKTKEAVERIRANALAMESAARTVEGMQGVADVVEVEFEDIHKQMRSYYRPKDVLEDILVRRIARCTWRLQVLEAIEEHAIENVRLSSAPGASMQELSVIERRTDVMLHRAIQALTAKRKQDRENMKNKLAELPPPGKWPRPAPDFEEAEAPKPQEARPQAVADRDQTRQDEPSQAQGHRVGPQEPVAPDARPGKEPQVGHTPALSH